MNDESESLTIVDTLGRNWTIITTRAVAGFQWRIYLYRGEVMPGDTLELLHPSGVAHGWTDDDHEAEHVRALLVSMMGLKDGTPKPEPVELCPDHGDRPSQHCKRCVLGPGPYNYWAG